LEHALDYLLLLRPLSTEKVVTVQAQPKADVAPRRRGAMTPSQLRKGSSTSICGCCPPKRAFLGLLGWSSYGTEGTQRVANVRLSGSAKRLDLGRNRCHRLPPVAVWIAW